MNFPDVSCVYELKVTQQNLSANEQYESFKAVYDRYIGKDDASKICRAVIEEFFESGFDENGNNVDYPNGPLYADYAERIENGDYTATRLYVDTAEHYILTTTAGLLSFNCGKCMEYEDIELEKIGPYMPSMFNETIEIIDDVNFEKTISFANGGATVKQAVENAESFFEEYFTVDPHSAKNLKAKVENIRVIDFGDNIQGLSLAMKTEYNGICFDISTKDEASLFTEGMSNDKDFDCMPGYAFMIESDTVDAFMFSNITNIVEENESYTEILTLTNATQILSEAFSSQINLNVSKIDFVYLNELTSKTARPCWKYCATNENDGLTYSIFVDAINGNVEYYIQG